MSHYYITFFYTPRSKVTPPRIITHPPTLDYLVRRHSRLSVHEVVQLNISSRVVVNL